MNREIKFRAWDKKFLEMVEISELRYNSTINSFYPCTIKGKVDKWYTPFDDQCILMQFTGLKDKNGMEIFEGDILKFFDKPVAIVVYQDFGGWSYKWIDKTYKAIRRQNPEPFFTNIGLFEVIGNQFENPELLNSLKP